MLDRPQAVREGEELDVEALAAFLTGRLPGFEGTPEVEQFPSGFSNLTYLLRWDGREAVLRRPPFGSEVRSAHDMGREFRVLSALDGAWAKAPRPLVYCDDPAVVGAPFYVMERVEGVILRSGMPAEAEPPADEMRGISAALVDTLAELHAVDYRAAGLADLGRPEGYAERQVAGWSRRWEAARTDDVPEMERVAGWLAENLPRRGSRESGAALIHNDFKYDNLVLDPADRSRVLAVLDWEMATIGDPWLDLGTTLGYWVEPDDPPALRALALSPTTLPGNPTRAEVVERYGVAAGRACGEGAADIPDAAIVACWVYGLFKIAVVIQQIYARYRAGHTSDPRFAGLLGGVRACAETAALAIDKGRLDRLHEV